MSLYRNCFLGFLTVALITIATNWCYRGQSHEVKNHDEEKRHVAVLHVGPHKTGTSAIQSVTRLFVDTFQEDNYIVVDYDFNYLRGMGGGRATHNLAMCSCPADSPENDKCHHGLLNATKSKLPANHSLILSHESMDRECIDVTKVRSVLYPKWDVKVVVGYRRFYEWIISFFKQKHRTDDDSFKHGKQSHFWPSASGDDFEVEDLKHWLTPETIKELYGTVYSTAVYHRYSAVFEDVSILNMHNVGDDLVGAFVCEQVPDATHACQKWKKSNIEPPNSNPRGVTVYDEIALEAHFLKLLPDGMSRDDARDVIQHRQEEVLNLTHVDFPKTCIDDEVMGLVLELSLEAERTMVPEFFDSARGETVLRSKFETDKNTVFCAVDYDELWKQNGWLDFFQNELILMNDTAYAFAKMDEEVWEEIDEAEEDLKRHRYHLRR
mmetsp:Transcript_25280/g.37053  ORF Transcript_25280/g.37053 Transcript_25280/m.37053 type:complete len:437 (+) Transcript_25280:182-1492(+)